MSLRRIADVGKNRCKRPWGAHSEMEFGFRREGKEKNFANTAWPRVGGKDAKRIANINDQALKNWNSRFVFSA